MPALIVRPSYSRAASIEAITAQFEANLAATTPFVGAVLEPGSHDDVVHRIRRYLEGRKPLFSARIAGGQICDGHGDLQAADIYCLEDGPRILDCLEFDDELRFGDVAADVAFLAMDLERLGHPVAANLFVRHYEESNGAPFPPSLLHFYVALRAYVRVKVACLRHDQGDPLGAPEAVMLLALARNHLEQARVRLVLVGGLPGSGKSTLAAGLGTALAAPVVRSDLIRQELPYREQGDPAEPTFGTGRYSREITQRVYGAMLDAARVDLGLGRTVVLDASWVEESHRDEARRVAEQCGADVIELRCTAPSLVREERITTAPSPRFRSLRGDGRRGPGDGAERGPLDLGDHHRYDAKPGAGSDRHVAGHALTNSSHSDRWSTRGRTARALRR